jgi:hypothetical protein
LRFFWIENVLMDDRKRLQLITISLSDPVTSRSHQFDSNFVHRELRSINEKVFLFFLAP